ncbi:unnamed protein product [Rotaria magnacalcarata]|nr:unnamed protein product [Rotaria magnacalcarata]CAF2142576.1 unnamed protein product [Rotaria magnacalcarata]CAF3763725.1 unnamed protein product [Rotaria magnacalcarata]CAF3846054.1 unnamed protein product [Rotaria magnacalcarata]
MVGTKPPPPPTTSTCPAIDEIKSTMEKLFDAQTEILLTKLAEMEKRLNELESCNPMGPSELFMGIYENLTIYNDWTLLYNKPYNHSTTSTELKAAADQCYSDRVVVGAMENENSTILNVAAVGPTRVLYLNVSAETPEEIENVLWYLESGRTFGFRPTDNDPNESPRSELFLGWYVDVNYGGWRAGKATNLYQNSKWRKIIYCMPTF